MSRTWSRWAPAAVAVVVVAGAAIAVPAVANASVSLPIKTPAQVLELVASSKVTALSGTVSETSDLGLPSLPAGSVPSGGQSGTAADLALLTGPNSLRVYVDGSKKVRVQDLESLAERDVVRNGSNVWVYDSKDNSVEHAMLQPQSNEHFARPGATPQGASPGDPTPNPADLTPEGIATSLLAQLKSSSTVTVGDDARVAGRPAYDLVLTPKVTDTLIGSVSIAVDADTGLPLQVQVNARGQKTPAVSIGFSSIDLSAPAASLFEFTPPAGAKVTELTKHVVGPRVTGPKPEIAKPNETVTGRGWDAVVSIAAQGELGSLASSSEFAELTTAVAGGRVLHTTLFNILFTTDGRVVAGSVSVARLQEVATGQ
ncbi:MAG TPA: sigma-E factor regulatory protein RseB domain-containing protein [Galbitalea sp.]|jgi:outer membrane lipoprotein-sorting protein|nr:sigma-E factor regulatory protein RseB domain-containing protein [Galbitalea sp.]